MPNKSATHSTLQLWLCRVGESTKQIEQETENLLSPSEKHRFNITKNTNKKREFLVSRALMRHALSQQFHIPVSEWQFTEKANSAPIINNLPENIYSSLSHSNGFISFVTSTFPIGIDVELTSKKRDFRALADVFMSDEEINLIKNYDEDRLANDFYRIWCAKEAYYKANSATQLDIRLKEISIFPFIDNHSDWNLIEENIDHFRLSIIVKNKLAQFHHNWYL